MRQTLQQTMSDDELASGWALEHQNEFYPHRNAIKPIRTINDNLSEYLFAVNAEIRQVEVVMVPETDDRVICSDPAQNAPPALKQTISCLTF